MGNPVFNAKGDNLLYGGEINPSVTPIDMPKGAVYIHAPEVGVPQILQKLDDGVTTNFNQVPAVPIGSNLMVNDFSNAIASVANIDLGGFNLLNVGSLNGTGSGLDISDAANVTFSSALVDMTSVTDLDLTGVNVIGFSSGNLWSDPVDSSLIPDTDATYNIGNGSTQRFNQLWLADGVISGNAGINTNYNNGSVTRNGGNMFFTVNDGTLDVRTTAAGASGVITIETLGAGANIEISTNSGTVDFTGANAVELGGLSIGIIGASFTGALVPTTDNSHDLGSGVGNRWNDLWLGGLATIGTPGADRAELNSSNLFFRGPAINTVSVLSAALNASSGSPSINVGSGFVGPNQNTGNVTIRSEAASGSGNSGNLTLSIGAGAAQGNFKFLKDGVAPSIGDVWTATAVDGTGYWAPASGGDLWSDPVDANVVPDANNTRVLGSAANNWQNIHTRLLTSNDALSINADANMTLSTQGNILIESTVNDITLNPLGFLRLQSDVGVRFQNVSGDLEIASSVSGDFIVDNSGSVNFTNNGEVNASGATAPFVVPHLSSDPGSPQNGSIWYNTVDNQLKCRANGVTVVLA